jgi:predicted nucleic acid-binding protein
MNDSVFLDTNILVYTYSDTEIEKQAMARKLVLGNFSFVSTQVLQELANTLNRKFKKPWSEITVAVKEVHTNSEATILQACKIADRYKFSFYDSLVIAAALECNCSKLYSEDLNHLQRIEGKITIINPFRGH